MVHLGDVNPTVWDSIVEVMETKLKDIEFQEEDIIFDWRIAANSRKLERELFEKYGFFKDIILHPTFQYWKTWAEENVNLNPILGDSLMPFATAVIVLFMLHRRVSNNVIILAAAFIFNVNPIYVSLAMISWWMTRGAKKPKQFIKAKKSTTAKDAISYMPRKFVDVDDLAKVTSETYDHVLLGNDVSTLYTAAILSRCGHKCCVVQPKGTAPVTVRLNALCALL
jgi:hypothetical protein